MDASKYQREDWLDQAARSTLPRHLVIGGETVPAQDAGESSPWSRMAHALEKYTELKTTWIAL